MNHVERVYLAYHMMRIGKSDMEIIKRFSHFEDFDKKITEQHIKAMRNVRRGY